MQFNLKDIESVHAQALFANGDTVTIQLFDKDGSDVTPSSPDDECSQLATTGVYRWPYANLAEFPKEYEEYLWIMTNQVSKELRDVDTFSSVPNTIFFLPHDVDIEAIPINKGDSWQPEFRVNTNAENLRVAVELTDGETTINKYTANIADGSDSQILLLSETGAYKIYRLFVTEEETTAFDSRFMDMTITAQTTTGQTQTIKNKISFTELPALLFDPEP